MRALAVLVAGAFAWANVLWPATAFARPDETVWTRRRQALAAKPSAIPEHSQISTLTLAKAEPARAELSRSLPALSAVRPDPLVTLGNGALADGAVLPADWAAELPLSGVRLESAFVPAKRSAVSPKARVVIVKDLHGQAEAQRNIAAFLKALGGRNNAVVVGLEGAAGRVDFGGYRSVGDETTTAELGEAYLEREWIQGGELAGLTGPASLRFTGVEDKDLYAANVRAYREARPRKAALKRGVGEGAAALAKAKETIYTAEERELERLGAAFRSKRTETRGYVKRLRNAIGSATGYPELKKFLTAAALEEKLDFSRAEEERRAVMERLTEVLDAATLEGWIRRTLAYRVGELESGAYERYMASLCEKAGVRLSGFPHFYGYVKYSALADAIDRVKFFAEIEKAEEEAWSRSARSRDGPARRRIEALRRASKDAELLAKLADQNLTDDEWYALAARRDQFEDWSGRVRALTGAGPGVAPADVRLFARFYETAAARNEVLARNLLASLAGQDSPLAVLVAGGFHATGVGRMLQEAGIEYAVVSPRIRSIEEKDALSVFVKGRSPLDRVLLGEKIFLADPVTVGTALLDGETAGTAAAQAELWGALQAVMGGLATEDLNGILASGALAPLTSVSVRERETLGGAERVALTLGVRNGAPIDLTFIVKRGTPEPGASKAAARWTEGMTKLLPRDGEPDFRAGERIVEIWAEASGPLAAVLGGLRAATPAVVTQAPQAARRIGAAVLVWLIAVVIAFASHMGFTQSTAARKSVPAPKPAGAPAPPKPALPAAPAAAFAVEVSNADLRASDVFFVRVPPQSKPVAAVEGEFAGAPVRFFRTESGDWFAAAGLAMDQPAATLQLSVRVTFEDGSVQQAGRSFKVRARPYRNDLNRRTTDDDASELTEERLGEQRALEERMDRERALVDSIYANPDPAPHYAGAFRYPVVDSGGQDNFGARRSMTVVPSGIRALMKKFKISADEARAYKISAAELRRIVREMTTVNWRRHEGDDLRAAEKTPVFAANRGRVALAQDLWGSGNSVIVDHGGGFWTVYYHLSRIDDGILKALAAGKPVMVEKGDRLGLSGHTSAFKIPPHLHWGARIGNKWVEPKSLLKWFGETPRAASASAPPGGGANPGGLFAVLGLFGFGFLRRRGKARAETDSLADDGASNAARGRTALLGAAILTGAVFFTMDPTVLGARVVLLPILVFCAVAHEWLHAYVAQLFGDQASRRAGRLTLNPFAHFDPLGALAFVFFGLGRAKALPVNMMGLSRTGRFATALAGPVGSVALALVFVAIYHVVAWTGLAAAFPGIGLAFQVLVNANVSIAVFNLIPLPSLDGSWMLQSLLPRRLGDKFARILPHREFGQTWRERFLTAHLPIVVIAAVVLAAGYAGWLDFLPRWVAEITSFLMVLGLVNEKPPSPDKDLRGAARTKIFWNNYGMVMTPTVAALSRHGLLDVIRSGREFTLRQIVRTEKRANAGYVQVALRMMVSQGWLTWKGRPGSMDLRFALTPAGRAALDHTAAYEKAAEFTPLGAKIGDYLFGSPRGPPSADGDTLRRLVDLAASGWDIPEEADETRREARRQVINHLNGSLAGPVAVGLKMAGVFEKFDRSARTLSISSIDGDRARLEAAFDALALLGWVVRDGDLVTLTPEGVPAADLAWSQGVTASYLPTFAGLDELMFGDPRKVLRRDASGRELAVNRLMNVLASGAQHTTYFKKIDEAIIHMFNQPFEKQPKFICDMGSGDGTFLKHLYEVVLTQTKRGELIRRDPEKYGLTMIGADFNEEARNAADRTLTAAGIPHAVVHGDINDPDALAVELEKLGLGLTMEDGLHVRSFLDHNRPYISPRHPLRALRRRALSTGAFASAGRLIPNNVLEQNLAEFFGKWGRYATKHGLLILELHTIDPGLAAENLGRTLATAYDATHGFSDQYLVELDVFLSAALEAGLEPVAEFQQKFPNSNLATISINYFRRSREPAPAPTLLARLTEWLASLQWEEAPAAAASSASRALRRALFRLRAFSDDGLARAAARDALSDFRALKAAGEAPSAARAESLAGVMGLLDADESALRGADAPGVPSKSDGESLREALKTRFADRRGLARRLARLAPRPQLRLESEKFRPQEMSAADVAEKSPDAPYGVETIRPPSDDPSGSARASATGRAGRVAEAVAAAFARAAGGAADAPASQDAQSRAAAAYRRGLAIRRYLDDPSRRGEGLVGGFDQLIAVKGDRTGSSDVVTFDLFGVSADAVDYAAAAQSLLRVFAASRDADRAGAPNVVLVVDVPGASAADVAARLQAAVARTGMPAGEIDALSSGWLAVPRASLEFSGRGPVDAEAFHAWLAREKGAAWSLGRNFVLSILTSDESRWKASRSEYIRVLQLLLPGVAVHVTQDLQDFLKSQQTLEIQA